MDKLQTLGINVSDIQKLKNAGFCTVLSVLQATKKELMNIKGITEGKLEKIQTSASELEKDKVIHPFILKLIQIFRLASNLPLMFWKRGKI